MTESITTYAQLESSRIRILDAPILNPGTCALCGASRTDDRKYVDFGLTVDYVGVIYFCTFCMTELANRVGCATAEQTKKLEDELNSARQAILDFQAEKAALDDAISTLRSTGLFSGTDLSPITNPANPPVAESGNIQDVVSTESKSNRSNKSTKQSDSEQGSVSISKSGSDDFTFGL
jgi:hypothetical protein